MSILGVISVVAALMQGLDSTGTAIARPIGEAHKDPTSGNYYQIFEFYGPRPYTWRHARRMVRGYIYEGMEGQLASVKELSTHYFLLLQFPKMREMPTWIGLSAQCNETAELTWQDGSSLADQSFRAWGADAQATISRYCRAHKLSGDTIPIYYKPDQFGVRWEAGNEGTDLQYMVVEFSKHDEADKKDAPTGQ
ncbi:MAG: C-type lectin domain-containing protein [Alphaproteobacteria bacterium]|nr:MAG: C-type lectin domain-containing protein [Alphaproteobacteria bacterium]